MNNNNNNKAKQSHYNQTSDHLQGKIIMRKSLNKYEQDSNLATISIHNR